MNISCVKRENKKQGGMPLAFKRRKSASCGKIIMKKKILDSILLSLLLTAIVAGTAMLFTDTKSDWYIALQKPSIQPPAIVFPIVWTVVYLLFAASLTLVQLNCKDNKTYVLFVIQGVLNILWCLFFFTAHLPLVALVIIIGYLISTYLTMRRIYSCSKTAFFLFLPQCVWLVFAAVLNYMIVLLN